MDATRRVLGWFGKNRNFAFQTEEALVGGIAYEKTGPPDPDATIAKAKARRRGAVRRGRRPEMGSAAVRQEAGTRPAAPAQGLELFANLRPALCFDALKDASTLKPEIVSGLDILIVRELTGGVYFGEPKETTTLPDGQKRAVDTQVYTTSEIERIARVAFELARLRGKRVASAEKSNVMVTGVLWREVVTEVHAKEFPDVELTHVLADNCAMQLVRNPKQYRRDRHRQSVRRRAVGRSGAAHRLDRHAAVGLARRQRADGKQAALYEPIHGSAPDIAGKGLANPIACILSFAMCLRYSFGRIEDAKLLEKAVERVLAEGYRTGDIMQPGMTKVGTGGDDGCDPEGAGQAVRCIVC